MRILAEHGVTAFAWADHERYVGIGIGIGIQETVSDWKEIHPSNSEVAGLPCVPSLSTLPAPPELALLDVGSFVVPGLGVEPGADGPAAVRELHRIAEGFAAGGPRPRPHGLRRPERASAWLGTIPDPVTAHPQRMVLVRVG